MAEAAPTPSFNLADLFEIVAAAVGHREAVVCGDRRRTYRALDRRADRLAAALAGRGVGPGDHVALALYNGAEYLETMLAAFKVGAVPVNLNYRYTALELRHVLDDCDAAAVVFDHALADTVERACAGRSLHAVLRVGTDRPGPAPGERLPVGVEPYEEALAAAARPPRHPRSGDDRYVLYTGGTTGLPKGVVWRHEDLFRAALGGDDPAWPLTRPADLAARARDARPLRCLPACPLMHGTGHWMAWTTLLRGGTVVLSAGGHFDPAAIWRLVAGERVHVLVIVGDAFARPLLDALAARDGPAPSCPVILSGGALLSPATREAMAHRLPGTLVVDGLGASETGGQGRAVTVAGTVSPALGNFHPAEGTTVVDASFRPVAPGRTGRLARRGHVPVGYHGDPARSAEVFPVVDGVRWAAPGDHGRLEADGTITLFGRGDAAVNTGGEKVYPEEVEAVLRAHPGVLDAVVIGLPDPRWGEIVAAVVAPAPGAGPTAAELTEHTRAALAPFKVPRVIALVTAVRRGPAGKPDHEWARRAASESRAGVAR